MPSLLNEIFVSLVFISIWKEPFNNEVLDGECEASTFLISGILATKKHIKSLISKQRRFHERSKIEQKSLVTLLQGVINHPILAPFIGNLSSFQQKHSLKDLMVINCGGSRKSSDGNIKRLHSKT